MPLARETRGEDRAVRDRRMIGSHSPSGLDCLWPSSATFVCRWLGPELADPRPRQKGFQRLDDSDSRLLVICEARVGWTRRALLVERIGIIETP